MDIKVFCTCGFELKAVGTHMASEGWVFIEVEKCKWCENRAAQQSFVPDPETGEAKSDNESTPAVSGR